ncbi:MAG: cell division protein FtsW [Oscillospiraceae bacterium]|nr:cell division protein FtsW [Oscillospiraceae bacterium]
MDQAKPPRSAQQRGTPREKQRTRPNTITRFLGEVDRPFLLIVLLLVCIGSIAVFSSSYAHSAQRYGDSYALARPQLMYVLLGITAMGAIAISGPLVLAFLKKFAFLVYLVALAMNAAVRFIGENYNGATRWITILGIQFQPSEFLKFALVLVCARHIVNNRDRLHTFRYGLLPFGLYGIGAIAMTLMQSHLSATIINALIVYIMMWLGGIGAKLLGIVTALVAAAGTYVLTVGRGFIEQVVPHALDRLKVWDNPFEYMSNASGGKGWQPAQSLYAISSGGFWGLGLGRSNQKHGYLPEPYNDYIFAIICEEMGFFGAVLVIGLFAALAWRGFHIANRSQDQFSSLLVMGITAHVVIQVALNLAVVTNTIPSTGISLPFFSYGGTSLIILLCEMGLILAVSRYSYTEKG